MASSSPANSSPAGGSHANGSSRAAPLPPQNLEAEEYVLGAMMLSQTAIEAVSDIIDAGDFYRESHAKIYRAALDLFQRGFPVDAITVSDKLDENGELQVIGGKDRVREIATLVPATSNAGHHAKIVREMATLRGLTVVGEQIQRLGWERPGETPELVDQAEQMVFDLAQHRIRGSFEHIEVLVRESFEQITKMYESGGQMTGTPTGFRDLDSLTSGLQPGNLVVVAGRPSMGKSAFAMGIASNLALHHGIPVAIFTLEMSKLEVAQRLMCSEGRVELQRLRTGRLTPEDWPRLVKACDALTKAPIYVDDTRLTTMLEIRGKARRLKAREPNLGLIMIDYLQLMTSGSNAENRVQEVSQISRSLKVLAGDLEVPVLALSQLSRAVESRTDKRPLLSDLRDSGCLTGESRVYLPDEGVYRPIRDLVGTDGFRVLAVDTETWKLEPRVVTNAFSTGTKPVYRLTTRRGQSIRATGNHKFLAFDGWRQAGTACELRRLATSDVYWDEIVSIEPDGVEEVFDLTVEGLHNFVAEDIVVHNNRAGLGSRDVPLPGRVPQRAQRGSGARRGDSCEAPQRASRDGEARVPQALREVLRPRAAARLAGGGRMRENVVWIAPGATRFSCLCEACLDGRGAEGASFLDAVRVATVRGTVEVGAEVAFARCSSGHELVVRRGTRPPNLARRDAQQLQLA